MTRVAWENRNGSVYVEYLDCKDWEAQRRIKEFYKEWDKSAVFSHPGYDSIAVIEEWSSARQGVDLGW
jgi:hypothetical protein